MLYFKAKPIILQELNMERTEEAELHIHQPDTVRKANKKVKRNFLPSTANLILEITKPVDNTVSQAIFIDPILRKLVAREKGRKK